MSERADQHAAVRTTCLVILATVAGVAALYVGREFFAPIAFAFLFNAILRPVVRRMEQAGFRTSLAAAIVVLAILGLLVAGVYLLAGPVQHWAQTAPQHFDDARGKLERFREPLRRADEVAHRIQSVAEPTSGPTSAPAPAPPAPGESLLVRAFGTTSALVGGVTEVLVLLYLLLASGDSFLRKLLNVIRRPSEKREAVDIVEEVQRSIFRYFLVTLIINVGQAVCVMLVLWMLKMPGLLLWGLLTIVLEFVPYLGAAAMIVMLSISALATFDTLLHAALVPAAYLLITTIQNNLVSPILYGNHLRLNPTAVLVGVIAWWYVWGIPGAFIAVPLIAAVKIVADHSERLRAVSEFLGE